MFEVNDKVVCVDDSSFTGYLSRGALVKGRVYVIRDIFPQMFSSGPGTGVRLTGLIRVGIGLNAYDFPFGSNRFRKLSDIQAENRAKAKQKKEKLHELAQ